jgi:uncharacterized protein YciI
MEINIEVIIMNEYFLIIHKPGPAWIEGKGFHEQPLLEHGAHIHNLYQEGILLEGGPFLDHSGGMALIKVDSLEQAEGIINKDPAILSGVFTADLHPWMRVDWENYG